MMYDTCVDTSHSTQPNRTGRWVMIAGLAAVIALLVLGEGKDHPLPQYDSAAPVTEDWHGNVRRSNWNR